LGFKKQKPNDFFVIPNEVRNLANLRFLPEPALCKRFLVAPLLEMTEGEGVEMTRRVYNFEIPIH